jgi:hypothetical protein
MVNPCGRRMGCPRDKPTSLTRTSATTQLQGPRDWPDRSPAARTARVGCGCSGAMIARRRLFASLSAGSPAAVLDRCGDGPNNAHERWRMNRPSKAEPRREPTPELQNVLDLLTEDHRMLLTLREELYDGSWQAMLQDLRDRLEGRPHVFEWTPPDDRMRQTLANHMKLIEQMRKAELDLGVNLARWLSPPEPHAEPPTR